MNNIKLYNGDCLKIMPELIKEGVKVDAILCDLPFGITKVYWDQVIPFEEMWKNINSIVKDNGAIILFGSEPFSSKLRLSNLKMYKYDYVWKKTVGTNFATVKKRPFKKTENIMVFYKKQPTYNPQMKSGTPYHHTGNGIRKGQTGLNAQIKRIEINNEGTRYPDDILEFSNGVNNRLHPTQKPVDLLEHLVKTYTNEGDTILDFCAGSMSTGVACINTNRNFIGIEKDENYFNIGKKRLEEI